jgi:hypothetical protein
MVGDEFKIVVKFGFHHQDAQFYQMDLQNYLNAGKCVECGDNCIQVKRS